MPEGDTIFRSAVRLREVLSGQRILAASGRRDLLDADSLTGCRIQAIEARGKHLLMHLCDRRAVHSHMGMTGSWHLYGLEQHWRKPRHRAALVLKTEAACAVCFSPKQLELLSASGLRRHRYLGQLGPDLLCEPFAYSAALQRFRVHDAAPIGEAVMNQTIVSGIGNEYKSEVLFLARISPFVKVAALPDESILRIIDMARQLLRHNLSGQARRTRFKTDGVRKWVYRRGGQACLECNTTILMRRQGDLGRSTYWCPYCQQP